jgi:hypothetical protein
MRVAAGIVLLIAGTVWLLQGLDVSFAPQSFMTGSVTWVLIGGAAIVAGVGLIWSSRRSSG